MWIFVKREHAGKSLCYLFYVKKQNIVAYKCPYKNRKNCFFVKIYAILQKKKVFLIEPM